MAAFPCDATATGSWHNANGMDGIYRKKKLTCKHCIHTKNKTI